jgi:type II secretory pathway pseudopilin PulG
MTPGRSIASPSRLLRRAAPAALSSRGRRRHRVGGFTLVQVMVAVGVVAICGLASIQALMLINRKAAAMRVLISGRAVVQRNIDTALGVPFSSTQQPAILAITSTSGATYDEGNGTGLVNVVLLRDGTTALIKGTLTRTVIAEPNAQSQDVRRVTFQLSYAYRSRTYTYSMTTLRAPD